MTVSLFLLDSLSLTKIPELSNPSVCMKDPERVQEILESMVKAGSNTVQVHTPCSLQQNLSIRENTNAFL